MLCGSADSPACEWCIFNTNSKLSYSVHVIMLLQAINVEVLSVCVLMYSRLAASGANYQSNDRKYNTQC